jgi:enamine deaminase RidA (YjgF/YER057c/UK114 family)
MSLELRFRFGQPGAAVALQNLSDGHHLTLHLPNRLLEGSGLETWRLPGSGEAREYGDLLTWRGESGMAGIAAVAVDDNDLEAAAARLYTAILDLTGDLAVYRFWNFVPQINASVGELDRYMCFCVGRANAFNQHANPVPGVELPPASAVGTTGNHLCVAFIAGPQTLTPVENPLQVPAYRYPKRYGPRSPSFARAGVIDAEQALFISGTASIRASESLHVGDFVCQMQTALENVAAVSEAATHPQWVEHDSAYRKVVRVYVKRADLWHEHGDYLRKNLLQGAQQINVIEADICRPELLVEMEAFAAIEQDSQRGA